MKKKTANHPPTPAFLPFNTLSFTHILVFLFLFLLSLLLLFYSFSSSPYSQPSSLREKGPSLARVFWFYCYFTLIDTGNANLPIGIFNLANQEIGDPGVNAKALRL